MRQNITDYISLNFPKLVLRSPLFYQWTYSLRFALENNFEAEEYFHEVVRRASAIYSGIFDSEDEICIIYQKSVWRQRKIRKNEYLFKQIIEMSFDKVKFEDIKKYYDCEIGKRAIIFTKAKNILHQNLFTSLANTDFYNRRPRLRGELFFINMSKDVIILMYDDRGMDVISKSKNIIEPLYQKFNSIILEYDREQIDKVFKNAL
jgi:hypothetical protein